MNNEERLSQIKNELEHYKRQDKASLMDFGNVIVLLQELEMRTRLKMLIKDLNESSDKKLLEVFPKSIFWWFKRRKLLKIGYPDNLISRIDRIGYQSS